MTRVFDDDLDVAFATRAIHAGQRPEPLAGAIMTPVYLTSTYVQEGLGQNKGYEYARGKNPTREALERNVAALEGGRHGFAFSSGMGCVDSTQPGSTPPVTIEVVEARDGSVTTEASSQSACRSTSSPRP